MSHPAGGERMDLFASQFLSVLKEPQFGILGMSPSRPHSQFGQTKDGPFGISQVGVA